MAVARARRREARQDYWPAFVDVLTNLLLVFIFLLSIFALVQFFLSREITGRDTLLDQLRNQIATLTEQLAMEEAESLDLNQTLAALRASLAAAEGARDAALGELADQAALFAGAGNQIAALEGELADQEELSAEALSQVEILNQQIAALRTQLAAIEAALEASEAREEEAQVTIADLGQRLNTALMAQVEELRQYRSEFFGRLREILGDREDIAIVGDRFVFQSEVLFATGDATLNPAGQAQMAAIAQAIVELEDSIPEDIDWVLRVDGHTDVRPIAGGQFDDNWDLSTERATSVVRFLEAQGVAPDHLVAAGFGEFQPLVDGDTEEAYARNRRIELKLTER
ncbi:MAG: peptidoglycan -binding protein [Bauldia sp.]|nr:peptidoglycan -binding protein [Bauldia sp.]